MSLASPPMSSVAVAAENLFPPNWICSLTGLAQPALAPKKNGMATAAARGQDFCRISVKIEKAASLAPPDLRLRTRTAYRKIFEQLAESPAYHPVRFWNFLPSIHEKIDGTQSRYMVFNAGRFEAFEHQYGDREMFDRDVPTASAVGHKGKDLWIHCLACRSPGIHLGNIRQVSPHRYSARFGRLPPCFARATLLAEKALLLIGGTASICGEESLHDDLPGQTRETLQNLALLLQSEVVARRFTVGANPLHCMTELRVYHPRKADAGWLENHLRDQLPGAAQLTLMQSDLCRPELLVEIEAIAALNGVARDE